MVEICPPDCSAPLDRSTEGHTTSEHVEHVATTTGVFAVHVYGYQDAYDPIAAYRLSVSLENTGTPQATSTPTGRIYLPCLLKPA